MAIPDFVVGELSGSGLAGRGGQILVPRDSGGMGDDWFIAVEALGEGWTEKWRQQGGGQWEFFQIVKFGNACRFNHFQSQ